MAETIIFQIDVNDAIKRLSELNAAIAENKRQQKDLAAQVVAGAISSAEAARGTEILKVAQKNLTSEYRSAQRVVEGYTGANKRNLDTLNFSNNTVRQNRLLLKQLTEQYNDADKSLRGKLQPSIKAVSDELKKTESAIGDNRREVGNYKSAFEGLTSAFADFVPGGRTVVAGFGAVRSAVSEASTIFDSFTAATENAASAQSAYVEAQTALADASEAVATAQEAATKIGFDYSNAQASLTAVEEAQAVVTAALEAETVALAESQVAATVATTAATGAMKIFKAALAATGIGLLVVGAAALFSVLSKFKPLLDGIENALDAVSAGFDAFVGGRNISEAVKASNDLLEVTRDLEDTQAAFNLQSAKSRNEIDRLIIASKDRTKSDKERLAFVREANRLEREIADEEVKRNQRLVREQAKKVISDNQITAAEYEILVRGTGQQTLELKKRLEGRLGYNEEEITALQENLLKKSELEGASLALQERLQNRENQLLEDAANDRKKRADEAAKQREKELAEIEKQQAAITKLTSEYLLTDRQRLIEKYANDLLELEKYGKKDTELYKAILKARGDALEQFDNEQLFKQNEAYQAQVDADRERAELAAEIAQEENSTILDVIDEFNASQFETFKEFYDAKKEQYDADTQAQLDAIDLKIRAQQAELQATESISSDIIGLIGQVADAAGAGAEFAKALAFVQILVSQAVAIGNAVAGATAAGAATGPGAVVAIPTFIATMVGAVVAVIGGAINLLKTPTPKANFASGGEVREFNIKGRDHNAGGTLFQGSDGTVFEAQHGEKLFVVKREASTALDVLGGFNKLYGGRGFDAPRVSFAASGGLVSDGGFAARNSGSQGIDINMLAKLLGNEIANIPAPVLSIVELNTAQSSRDKSIQLAGL